MLSAHLPQGHLGKRAALPHCARILQGPRCPTIPAADPTWAPPPSTAAAPPVPAVLQGGRSARLLPDPSREWEPWKMAGLAVTGAFLLGLEGGSLVAGRGTEDRLHTLPLWGPESCQSLCPLSGHFWHMEIPWHQWITLTLYPHMTASIYAPKFLFRSPWL